jgi:FkbM family methyltransferase
MYGITNTLESHLNYTKNEWTSSQYYIEVLNFLKKKQIKNFIDIGACSGGVSDIFFEAIPSLKKCIMVEPISSNYEFIINRFKNDNNRLTVNKALFYNKKNISIGSVGNNVGAHSYQSNINSSLVETITLEELYNQNKDFLQDKIDFIKIDIEGAEYNFIENSKLLKTIPFIEIEFHNNPEYNVIDGVSRHEIWGPFIEKYLPNHKLVYGGLTNPVFTPNGDKVVYDGSAFLILKEYEI